MPSFPLSGIGVRQTRSGYEALELQRPPKKNCNDFQQTELGFFTTNLLNIQRLTKYYAYLLKISQTERAKSSKHSRHLLDTTTPLHVFSEK